MRYLKKKGYSNDLPFDRKVLKERIPRAFLKFTMKFIIRAEIFFDGKSPRRNIKLAFCYENLY